MHYRIGAAAGFLATILAANYVTTHYGLIPVGFGLMATAGTYFAGAAFVLRDAVQDGFGKLATVGVIVIGGVLSLLIADPFIAVASASAFVLSELADMAIYTPLREHGYIRAAVVSNFVGSVVDTIVFLSIAGFGLADGIVAGQMVGKLTITAAVVLAIGAWRTRRAVAA